MRHGPRHPRRVRRQRILLVGDSSACSLWAGMRQVAKVNHMTAAQASVFEHIGHFGHRARSAVAQIPDHRVGIVDQHPTADLELLRIDPRIDIGIIFGTPYEDMSDAFLG